MKKNILIIPLILVLIFGTMIKPRASQNYYNSYGDFEYGNIKYQNLILYNELSYNFVSNSNPNGLVTYTQSWDNYTTNVNGKTYYHIDEFMFNLIDYGQSQDDDMLFDKVYRYGSTGLDKTYIINYQSNTPFGIYYEQAYKNVANGGPLNIGVISYNENQSIYAFALEINFYGSIRSYGLWEYDTTSIDLVTYDRFGDFLDRYNVYNEPIDKWDSDLYMVSLGVYHPDLVSDYYFNDGYEKGKADGLIDGYNDGLMSAQELYKDSWYNQGKADGYNIGISENISTGGFVTILSSAFIGVSTLLGIELLPNITLGMIVAVPLVFGILFFILGKRKD